MSLIELVLVAVGLSMDAFAAAICKGMSLKRFQPSKAALVGLFFGGFQALMPLVGWLLGSRFLKYISAYDHWIAFVLLGIIGGKMLWETICGGEEDEEDGGISIRELLVLAVATSIDAMAVGITFAVLPDTNIWTSVLLIGCVTFGFSFAGVGIGQKFGDRFRKQAGLAGGVILVLIGVKILLEHLGVF